MKNKLIKSLAAFAALFLVFALAGCPQAHDDLWTLDELFKEDKSIIQAEDGEPHGTVRNHAPKGSGTVGECMNELNPEGDGSKNYFTLTLPEDVSGGSYTVKFRYASGNNKFEIKFTVNGGDVVWTTGVVPSNGWDLGDTHDLAASTAPAALKAGDTLKVWTTDWGCIDYIKLEPAAK